MALKDWKEEKKQLKKDIIYLLDNNRVIAAYNHLKYFLNKYQRVV